MAGKIFNPYRVFDGTPHRPRFPLPGQSETRRFAFVYESNAMMVSMTDPAIQLPGERHSSAPHLRGWNQFFCLIILPLLKLTTLQADESGACSPASTDRVVCSVSNDARIWPTAPHVKASQVSSKLQLTPREFISFSAKPSKQQKFGMLLERRRACLCHGMVLVT